MSRFTGQGSWARFVVASGIAAAATIWAGRAFADGPPPPPPPPPNAAVTGPCGDRVVSCCPEHCYRLAVTGHVAWLEDGPEGPPGGVESPDPEPADWDALDYEEAWGGSVALEVPVCSGHVRVGGRWWGQWEDDATEFGSIGESTVPGGQTGTLGRFDVAYESEATLWDVDLMYWRRGCGCIEWGVGVRYVRFEEESEFSFDIGETAVVPGVAGPGPAPTTEVRVPAEADTGLLALQLGVRGERNLSSCLGVAGELDVFGGWKHTEREVGFTGGPFEGGSQEDDEFGWGLSVEVALKWRLGCNWSLVAGYGAIVLFDVPRAYQLADFSNFSSGSVGPADSEETLFAQRLFVGLELDW
jgi:hypothetical protein